jgi:hypothetical protein
MALKETGCVGVEWIQLAEGGIHGCEHSNEPHVL